VSGGPPPVEELRRGLAESPTVAELERRLLAVAPAFHEALRRRTMIGERSDLGLHVLSLDMPFQGLAGVTDSDTFVVLKSSHDSIRRRQALAHECAHGLLRDIDRAALRLSREAEDRLCTRFARRALMPMPRVRRYLARHGFPGDVDSLREFCRSFRVTIRTGIAALNEHGERAAGTVLIAATYRAHEKRPLERAFRVDAAAAAPDLFVPRDRRLISMGLGGLARWAQDASPGADGEGKAPHAIFRSRRPFTPCVSGTAEWSARALSAAAGYEAPGLPSLIAVLHVSRLRGLATDPTRSQASVGAGEPHPGQVRLEA